MPKAGTSRDETPHVVVGRPSRLPLFPDGRRDAYDSNAPYYDSTPLTVPTVAEVREYKLRGVINDVEIGLESDIVSAAFTGASAGARELPHPAGKPDFPAAVFSERIARAAHVRKPTKKAGPTGEICAGAG